jgi:GNAT superfamily N-acetyltransferase
MLTTTYLQMFAPPTAAPRPLPATAAILHAVQPTISFYRYLYQTVGHPYEWTDRQRLSDEALGRIIHDAAVEVQVLYVAGVPAGYIELDKRQGTEIEVAYFGLVPEFVGRGVGLPFLQWGIAHAWRTHPTRLWVHTCNLDHPNALSVYQKAGFVVYDVVEG